MWTRDRGSGFRIGTASVIGMENGSSLLCGSGPDPHMPGRKLPGMDGMDRNAVSGGNGFCPGEGNGNRRQQDRRNRRAAAAPGFGPARLHPGRYGLLRIVLKHGLHGIADGAAVFRRGPARRRQPERCAEKQQRGRKQQQYGRTKPHGTSFVPCFPCPRTRG